MNSTAADISIVKTAQKRLRSFIDEHGCTIQTAAKVLGLSNPDVLKKLISQKKGTNLYAASVMRQLGPDGIDAAVARLSEIRNSKSGGETDYEARVRIRKELADRFRSVRESLSMTTVQLAAEMNKCPDVDKEFSANSLSIAICASQVSSMSASMFERITKALDFVVDEASNNQSSEPVKQEVEETKGEDDTECGSGEEEHKPEHRLHVDVDFGDLKEKIEEALGYPLDDIRLISKDIDLIMAARRRGASVRIIVDTGCGMSNFLDRAANGMLIGDIARHQWEWVDRMGWHNKLPLEYVALIASEIGEVANECRAERPTDRLGEELADVILRSLDMAHQFGINIESEIRDKMSINDQRGTRGRMK